MFKGLVEKIVEFFKRFPLLSIVLLASSLRIYHLDSNPVALNQDEAVNGYDAYSLGITFQDHHGNSVPLMLESFGDWVSPTLTYLTIPFVKFLGLSEWSVRLPVASLGICTVILIYVLSMQLFNQKKIALIAAFLMAIMPWHITLSRWAIPPSIVPFFLLLFLVVFFWTVEDKETQDLTLKCTLVALLATLLTYSYPTQKLFVPLFLLAIIFIFIRRFQPTALIGLFLYILLVFPIYFLSFYEPEKYNARFNQVSLSGSGENIVIGFLLRYVNYLLPNFIFGAGDPDIMHQVPEFGSSYSFLAFFFYAGIAICVYNLLEDSVILEKLGIGHFSRKKSLLLLIWLLVFPIPASLTKDYNHLLRVVHGLPLIILFSSLGFHGIISFFKQAKQKQTALIMFICFCLFNAIDFTGFYFSQYQESSKEMYQFGIKYAMNYVIKNEDKASSIIVDNKINQPYIYYLFYAKYNPIQLNSSKRKTENPEPLWRKIGKYEFRNIDDAEIMNSKEVFQIRDQKRTWFKIYENSERALFMKRDY